MDFCLFMRPLPSVKNSVGLSPDAGVPAEVPGHFLSNPPNRLPPKTASIAFPLPKKPKPSMLQKAKTVTEINFTVKYFTRVREDIQFNYLYQKSSISDILKPCC